MSGTPLVVIPGLDGTLALRRAFAERTPAGFECRLLSYPLDQRLDYDALVERARAELPEDGELVLLGESFGGPIAVRLAAELGDRVRALVLSGSFVTPPGPRLGRFLPWGLIFRVPPPQFLLRWMYREGPTPPPASGRLRSATDEVDPDVLALRVRATLSVDERDNLRRCSCPVLYLQASHDKIVPKRCARRIQQLRPDAEVVQVATSHYILQREPDRAWRTIVDFLERQPAAG